MSYVREFLRVPIDTASKLRPDERDILFRGHCSLVSPFLLRNLKNFEHFLSVLRTAGSVFK